MLLRIRRRKEPNTHIIRTRDQLRVIVKALEAEPKYVLDTEINATAEEDFKGSLSGLSLFAPSIGSVFIPVGFKHEDEHDEHLMKAFASKNADIAKRMFDMGQMESSDALMMLDPIFLDKTKTVIGHNIKFDLHVLRREGSVVRNKLRDTMIMSWMVDENDFIGLKPRVKREFNHQMTEFKQLIGTGRSKEQLKHLTIPFVSAYACADAKWPWKLDKLYTKELERIGLTAIFEEVLMPLLKILYRMEDRGIRIDTKQLEAMDKYLTTEITRAQKNIFYDCGREFNLNSRDQLAEVLFSKKGRGLKAFKLTKGGKPSTDEETLKLLGKKDKVCAEIIKYRGLTKLKGTYIDGIKARLENGRIHTSFRMGNAVTGRLSSADPNLQNIPIRVALGKEIRNMFVPEKGEKLIVCDLKNIELRLLAHFAEDPVMLDAFKKGEDLHAKSAAVIFGPKFTKQQRGWAKNVNFGIVYGQGCMSLAEQLGVTKEEAQSYIDGVFETYPAVKPWIDQVHQETQEKLYVKTLLGRFRRLPEILTPITAERGSDEARRQWGLRARAQRQSVNSVIQGSAFDILTMSMVGMYPKLPKGCRMLLQVHDELVFSCPESKLREAQKVIKYYMEHPFKEHTSKWLKLPIEVDIHVVDRWGEAK